MTDQLCLMDYQIRNVAQDDVSRVAELEANSFPYDEAASEETIRKRQSTAGKYFFVIKAKDSDKCLGFINATCIVGETITHESMTEHVAEGKTLVIHSVTISLECRRKGVGSFMLKDYVNRIARDCREISKILLLSKAYLLRYYVSCGFSLVGLSPVEHGKVRKLIYFTCSLSDTNVKF
jgi:ribosomal protein S18 acetylase RimI-like enzyme